MYGSNDKLLIMGDFNYPEINWKDESSNCRENHPASRFLSCLHQNFLTQHIIEPTHYRGLQSATLIDLIISNDPNFVSNIIHDPPFGKSHHQALCFNIDIATQPFSPTYTEKYVVSKGDFEGMRTYINQINWDEELLDADSVDTCWEKIHNHITIAKDRYIPKKRFKNSQVQRSFAAPETLLHTIQLKRKAYKMYKNHPTTQNYQTYADLRNLVNTEVRETKKAKELKLAKEAKNNPKALFQYISSKVKPRETIPDLQKKDGDFTEGDTEKAETLNSFFGSVFTEEPTDDDLPECAVHIEDSVQEIKTNKEDFVKLLKNLKANKSPGPDGIHPLILKELAEALANPFKILFDKTMIEGCIPQDWKKAEVRPIFKKGAKTSPDNYRPVSLTSVVCKLFEKLVRDALYNHMIKNKFLSTDQFGFCPGRSCVTQLLVTINDWMFSLDNKIPVDAAYLDFSKAFDSVPHQRLLHKLHAYGVRGKVLDWVKSFLSDRTQYVSINNEQSSAIPVTSGVPQGSVLGPTLFIYYINDLPDATDQIVRLFADDSKIYSEIRNEDDSKNLQKGIDNLVEWSSRWLMKFNAKKCKILHLGKNNPNHEYFMTNGTEVNKLDSTTCEKDLGVNVDPLLSFDNHINMACSKGRQLSGMILNTLTCRCSEILVPLFKAIIRPHLEYANAVWSPYKVKHIKLIEQVQRNFTRMIDGMRHLEYSQRLRMLKLPSLEFRRFRGDLIEVFKLTHEIYDPLTTQSLLSSTLFPYTRNNSYKLQKKHTNTTHYKHFFTNRVIDSWNNLPYEIVNAENVNQFKNMIDHHFHNLKYSTNLSDHD